MSSAAGTGEDTQEIALNGTEECDCRLPALRMIRMLRRYSLKDVADRTGLSVAYLQKLEHGQIQTPSPANLRKIASALEYPYTRLLVLAGYLDERDEVEACIASPGKTADPALAELDERLAVLATALGDARLQDDEANFIAASLGKYREMRQAGTAPPVDFLLSIMHEYDRLHAAGAAVDADQLVGG